MQKYAEICRNMLKCAEICRNMQKYAEICWNVLQNVSNSFKKLAEKGPNLCRKCVKDEMKLWNFSSSSELQRFSDNFIGFESTIVWSEVTSVRRWSDQRSFVTGLVWSETISSALYFFDFFVKFTEKCWSCQEEKRKQPCDQRHSDESDQNLRIPVDKKCRSAQKKVLIKCRPRSFSCKAV